MINFNFLNENEQYLYANYLYLRLILSFRIFGTHCCDGKLISILKNVKFWKNKDFYNNFIKFIIIKKDYILHMFQKELLILENQNRDLCPDCGICYKKRIKEFKAQLKLDKFKMFFNTFPEKNINNEKLPTSDDFEAFIINYKLYSPKERIELAL